MHPIRQVLYLTLATSSLPGSGCLEEGEEGRFPGRPIKVIVPFAPGGGTDTLARLFEKSIEEENLLSQPLVVINVDGAGGTIGSRRVKNAPADGYTLLLLHEAIVTAKHWGTVPYGPEAFEAVAATGEVGLLLAVRSASEHGDLRELMESARTRPAGVAFGANLGAPSHFVGLELEGLHPEARFRFVQTGGGARRFVALKGGHIDVTLFSVEEYLRFRTGDLRALAYLGERRHGALPSVPTAREQGFELIRSNVHFWWVPRSTPRERIDVLAAALKRAMESEAMTTRLAEMQCEALFVTGAALRERLDALEAGASSVSTRPTVALPDVPAIALGTLALLAGAVLLDGWRQRRRARQDPGVGAKSPPRPAGRDGEARTGLAVACLTLTIGYVLALDVGWLSFRSGTALHVFLTGALLTRLRPRSLPVVGVLALTLSCGLHYLLTRVFVIDLP
ncbi:MAG: tripartite tricarboxylate transporter substrate binding protein [Planctomycetota bacterium]|nr:tripartite tricarboxylate transporter substrate binding protein [Planctomycetota bacterium]